MRTLSVLVLLLSTPWMFSRAQHLQGTALGNYAGTNALYHNPAFVSDTRYSVFANLAGVNYYMGNNHVKWAAPFSFLSFLSNSVPAEYRNERGGIKFPRTYLAQRLNGNTKYLNTGMDLKLPALMISFKDGKYGIAFSTRTRAILNVSQTTESLAQLMRGSTQDTTLHHKVYENQQGKLQMNGFAEYAVTLGGVLYDNDVDFIKIGITAKKLIGLFHGHIGIDRASYEITPDPAWQNRRYMVSALSVDGNTGYTTNDGLRSISLNPNWWLGKTSPGSGWGLDIGAVYEYRPTVNKYSVYGKGNSRKKDGSKNKYLYRLSLSVTDIGKLGFKNEYYNRSQQASGAKGPLDYNSFQQLENIDAFFNAVGNNLQLAEAQPAAFRTALPTAVQMSTDYNLKPNLYVGALWVQTLRKSGVFGIRQESLLSVIPRYEHRWYEISLPVSVMNHYRSFGIGLAGRAGPLWFGTDHLPGLLNIGRPKSFTLYAGLSMGLFRKPPEDPLPCWPSKENWFRRLFRRER